MLEASNYWRVDCHPWDREFPIKMCSLYIIAKDKEEALKIAMENDHKFFDQDQGRVIKLELVGYKQGEAK